MAFAVACRVICIQSDSHQKLMETALGMGSFKDTRRREDAYIFLGNLSKRFNALHRIAFCYRGMGAVRRLPPPMTTVAMTSNAAPPTNVAAIEKWSSSMPPMAAPIMMAS